MTQTQRYVELDLATVTDALSLAVRAPSIHNTQPWSWELRHGVLSLKADRTRQLAVADSDGHSLLMSCGAALALAEIGLRAAGWRITVSRFPDSADPDLLAEFRGLGRGVPAQSDLDLAAAGRTRRSERRPFARGRLAADVVESLRDAAASQNVFVHFPVRDEENLDLNIAVSLADRFERNDAAYRAELAGWVRPGEATSDGIPLDAIPHVAADEPRHADVPLRDFEVAQPGEQTIAAGVDEDPLLAILLTTADTAGDQLAAGEAMMRMMLVAELAGVACSPLSQAFDMVAFRSRLRSLMGWAQFPQMLLRFGNAPAADPAPRTGRRPLTEVFRVIEV